LIKIKCNEKGAMKKQIAINWGEFNKEMSEDVISNLWGNRVKKHGCNQSIKLCVA